MSEYTEKERIVGLEVKVDNLDKAFKEAFLELKKQLATHQVQMENLVNNGLHQAQGVSEIARSEVKELKPRVEANRSDIHKLELDLKSKVDAIAYEKTQTTVKEDITKLEKKILIYSTITATLLLILNNLDKLSLLIK